MLYLSHLFEVWELCVRWSHLQLLGQQRAKHPAQLWAALEKRSFHTYQGEFPLEGAPLTTPSISTWTWEIQSFAIPVDGGSEESGSEVELAVPQSRPGHFGVSVAQIQWGFFLWFWFFCSSQDLGECCDTRLHLSTASSAQKSWLITSLLARGLRQTWNH